MTYNVFTTAKPFCRKADTILAAINLAKEDVYFPDVMQKDAVAVLCDGRAYNYEYGFTWASISPAQVSA